MASGGRHLQGALHVLLSPHVAEVDVIMSLVLVELLAGIHENRLESLLPVQELYHVGQRLHAIHFQVVDHGGLPGVLLGHDKSLEVLSPCPDGNGQGSLDGLQGAVQAQLSNHHVFGKKVTAHVVVGTQQADGQRQVETAAFLSEVGGSHVDRHFRHGKMEAAILHGGGHTVASFLDGLVSQTRKMELYTLGDAYLHGHGGNFQAVDRGAKCLNKHR